MGKRDAAGPVQGRRDIRLRRCARGCLGEFQESRITRLVPVEGDQAEVQDLEGGDMIQGFEGEYLIDLFRSAKKEAMAIAGIKEVYYQSCDPVFVRRRKALRRAKWRSIMARRR